MLGKNKKAVLSQGTALCRVLCTSPLFVRYDPVGANRCFFAIRWGRSQANFHVIIFKQFKTVIRVHESQTDGQLTTA